MSCFVLGRNTYKCFPFPWLALRDPADTDTNVLLLLGQMPAQHHPTGPSGNPKETGFVPQKTEENK